MRTLPVHIWSDIACPWCYVGKRRLEAALARFPHKDAVAITWRAFELDPQAPRLHDASVSTAERLARKYGVPVARAQGMLRSMTETAAQDGLDLHFERMRSSNTFDAHRLLHLATVRGRGDALKERLLRAYLSEGEAIGDVTVLRRLAAEAGLDDAEVQATLASDRYAREVRADEAEANALGIHGVPFFVIGRHGISGAQPPETLLHALEEAWQELEPGAAADPAPGASCTSDGCLS